LQKCFRRISTPYLISLCLSIHRQPLRCFHLLCLVFKVFIMYRIVVFKYLATLCWVWFAYHNYIRKYIIGCGIFWHYNESFGLLSNHFTYNFKGAWPFLSGLIYYPWLLGIGFWLFLHLSFVSSKIITLFFSMSWHMLKSSLFPSSSHCGISKLY